MIVEVQRFGRPFTGLASIYVLLGPGVAGAAPASSDPPAEVQVTIEQRVGEASRRFGLPAAWIASVMRVESGGNARAMSAKGAMGLMQIMPATWSDLRVRYQLGADPLDVRDNLLAGAAYLRELYDRYGPQGFLAAYNAGPGRYERALRSGRSLPSETVRYVAELQATIAGPTAPRRIAPTPIAVSWRAAPLFNRRPSALPAPSEPPGDRVSTERPRPVHSQPVAILAPSNATLFVTVAQ